MADIGYTSWAFLPEDADPMTGEPTTFNPPMISTLAVDHKTSIVFELATSPTLLNITVECTALTAEQPVDSFFYVLTGTKANQFTRLDHPDWELHYDGIYGLFTTTIQPSANYLKLHYNQSQNIIVSKIGFSTS